jgi:hypothetical protein
MFIKGLALILTFAHFVSRQANQFSFVLWEEWKEWEKWRKAAGSFCPARLVLYE